MVESLKEPVNLLEQPPNVSGMSREQIKNMLLERARMHLAQAETYEEITNEKGVKVLMTKDFGTNVTVSYMEANGLTLEDFQSYMSMDTWAETFTKQEDILTLRRLGDVDGLPLIYTHIKTPFIVSNRCNFDCYYPVDEQDGSLIQLASAMGNEAILDKEKKLVGRDVIATCFYAYTKITQRADGSGCDLKCVQCIDPAGALPEVIKRQIAKKNSGTSERAI